MKSVGTELSVELFAPATWAGHDATGYGAEPYPFLRPAGSWRLDGDGRLHGLDPDGSGWCERDTGTPVDLAGRSFILAYGSNPNPDKLLEKEEFIADGVVALRAAVFGWAAVWCDARRGDGTVVATLAEVPGRVEVHPVFALTPRQLDIMDAWEGHPRYYMRTRHDGPVLWESGRWAAEDVEVYLGTSERRPALRVGGRPVLCAEVGYAEIDEQVE